MKCVVLLLAVVSCASAYVYLNPYSYYSGVTPYLWRKKRSAEAPAEDQQADSAMIYRSLYGYPYSRVFHYVKKREAEAPAADQQADESALFYYSSYYGMYSPYRTYSGLHILKKREAEAPAEDQQADESALYFRNYYGMYSPYRTYSGLHILKKRAADPEKEEEKEKKKVVLIRTMPYTSLRYPIFNYPYIFKK